MKITNEFTVNTPIDAAWHVLTDLEGIAPCLPGAQLTGVDGDVYTGKVKVKVGPVVSEFAGTAQFVEKDTAGYRAVIDAKGKDSRAGGNASAVITAQLQPATPTTTTVTVDTDLKISGKLAQFGSGMIKEVSGKLLAQFVVQLEAKIATDTAIMATVDTQAEPAQVTDATPELAVSPPALERTAVVEPAGVPEPGPIPDDQAHREVAADAEYHANRAATPATTPAPSTAAPAATPVDAPAAAEPVPSTHQTITATAEPEALDLMNLAGSSIYKRLIPVGVAVVVVAAVVIWLVVR